MYSGIDREQEGVEVTTQVDCFCLGGLALGDQQIEQRGLVFSPNSWQVCRFTPHQHGDSLRIKWIALASVARLAPTYGGPARINLEDEFASCHQALSQPTAVVPCSLDPPLPRIAELCRPAINRLPTVRAVRPAPPIDDTTGIVKSDGHIQARSMASARPSGMGQHA